MHATRGGSKNCFCCSRDFTLPTFSLFDAESKLTRRMREVFHCQGKAKKTLLLKWGIRDYEWTRCISRRKVNFKEYTEAACLKMLLNLQRRTLFSSVHRRSNGFLNFHPMMFKDFTHCGSLFAGKYGRKKYEVASGTK